MATDSDLLAQMLIQLTKKESAPLQDDNTLIQKMIAPNDSVSMDDSNLTMTKLNPSTFKWGGNVNGVYQSPGWKWNQGQWASH